MGQPEFDPEAHERAVADSYERLARYQLFDELIDYALDGVVTLDEAINQFKHDVVILE